MLTLEEHLTFSINNPYHFTTKILVSRTSQKPFLF
jgi:hypothetical protein